MISVSAYCAAGGRENTRLLNAELPVQMVIQMPPAAALDRTFFVQDTYFSTVAGLFSIPLYDITVFLVCVCTLFILQWIKLCLFILLQIKLCLFILLQIKLYMFILLQLCLFILLQIKLCLFILLQIKLCLFILLQIKLYMFILLQIKFVYIAAD